MLERVGFQATDGFSLWVFVIVRSRYVDLNHFIYAIEVMIGAGKVAFILFVLFDDAMNGWPVDRLVEF